MSSAESDVARLKSENAADEEIAKSKSTVDHARSEAEKAARKAAKAKAILELARKTAEDLGALPESGPPKDADGDPGEEKAMT